MGALAAALGTMVANLSAHKRGWDQRWEEFSRWAEQGKARQDHLLALVDEDTNAFNQVLVAFRMPSGTPQEVAARQQAVEDATRHAMAVPFRVMEEASGCLDLLAAMAADGLGWGSCFACTRSRGRVRAVGRVRC